jgi:broad specificity phosphatase PhoE
MTLEYAFSDAKLSKHCLNFALIWASRQAKNEENYMVQRVFIVRHGETDYNAQHRWQGQIDVPLNPLGLAQAEKLAAHFSTIEIDAIFSSDLSRAYATAQKVAEIKNLPVIVEPRLREISVGVFEGLTREEIMQKYPTDLELWDTSEDFAPPNGESRVQVQERAYQIWLELIQQDDYETILISTHGAFIRMLYKNIAPHEYEKHKHIKNTSISLFERNEDGWKMIFVNQTPHLE